MSAADLVSRYLDYAVFGMEFAVCVFVGLRYAGYVFDYPEALDEVDIDFALSPISPRTVSYSPSLL